MPDALGLVGPIGVLLTVFVWFSISVISCCNVRIVVSSMYSDFNVLGDVALMRVKNPSHGLNKCLVYTTAELRTRVVAT